MLKNKKTLWFAISTFVILGCFLLIGPLDVFTHGFFCREIDLNQIPESDHFENISFDGSEYEFKFSPQKKHLAGFEIYLEDQPEDNTGTLTMRITDLQGNTADLIRVDLSKVKNNRWYKVYTNAALKKGAVYRMILSAEDCAALPRMLAVDPDYLPEETAEGNIVLAYGYREPVFTFENKVIISVFLFAVWLFLCVSLTDIKGKRCILPAAWLLLMTSVLTWNYMYYSMDDPENTPDGFFDIGSELLVTSVLYADQGQGYYIDDADKGYSLGTYYDLKGRLTRYDLAYETGGDWLKGYARSGDAVIADQNIYTEKVLKEGGRIRFQNGDVCEIRRVTVQNGKTVAGLDCEKKISPERNGSLDNAVFYDSSNEQLPSCLLTAYKSQYGLQGRVFRFLGRYIAPEEVISVLYLICCMSAALVFSVIVLLAAGRYNKRFAGCFFAVFWLSPWIIIFAKNLYWVEFTWFLPMAVGIFADWKIRNTPCRLISYVLAFLTVLLKCLCGYEYISTIMMSLIAFLLIDFILAVLSNDRKNTALYFRTIFVIGVMAVAGFVMAILIHAPLKGGGSVISGVRNILTQDVLRSSSGADYNDFGARYWPSFNSSVWEVLCSYFHFSTPVITGIPGSLFQLLCVTTLMLAGCDALRKKSYSGLIRYLVFFGTTVSWFCLAKSHSYIHIHLNFVLWYFGFVQICLYILLEKFLELIRTGAPQGERDAGR